MSGPNGSSAFGRRYSGALANDDRCAESERVAENLTASVIPASQTPLTSRTEIGMARAILMYAASTLLLTLATSSRCEELLVSANVPSATPCAGSAYRQFDFWIGNWDVFDVERPAVVVAHARVELILNGCVLHEVYQSLDGHKGESFSIYDGTRDTWHQSWVNDHGYLLTIEGRLRDGAMILEGTDHLSDGKPRQVRGQWRSQDHGVREAAVRSTDGGVTWVPWFDLLFLPHRPAA